MSNPKEIAARRRIAFIEGAIPKFRANVHHYTKHNNPAYAKWNKDCLSRALSQINTLRQRYWIGGHKI